MMIVTRIASSSVTSCRNSRPNRSRPAASRTMRYASCAGEIFSSRSSIAPSYGTPPERRTDAVLAPVANLNICGCARRSGAALEVGDILRLVLDSVLRVGELVLLLALPLLAPAFRAQRAVPGHVTGRLLGTSRDLVDDAHAGEIPRATGPKTRIASRG